MGPCAPFPDDPPHPRMVPTHQSGWFSSAQGQGLLEVQGPHRQKGELGGRGGLCETKKPLQQEHKVCCTPSPLWLDSLSVGTGTVPGPRTSQTIGQAWGRQVHVDKEAPAAGVGGPLCSFPGMPAQPCNGTHSPVWIVLSIRTGNPKLDYYIGLSINLNFLIIH